MPRVRVLAPQGPSESGQKDNRDVLLRLLQTYTDTAPQSDPYGGSLGLLGGLDGLSGIEGQGLDNPNPFAQVLGVPEANNNQGSILPQLLAAPSIQGSQTSDPVPPGGGFQINPKVNARDRYDTGVSDLERLFATDPNFQYGDYRDIPEPTMGQLSGPEPTLGDSNARASTNAGIDASLLMSGIGGLLGQGRFGGDVGRQFLMNANKAGAREDASDFASAQATRSAAERALEKKYSSDITAYGLKTKAIDARNDNITKTRDAKIRSLNFAFNTDQKAETAERAEMGKQNRNKMNVVLAALKEGRLQPDAAKGAAEFLSSQTGADMAGDWLDMTPEDRERLNFLKLSEKDKTQYQNRVLDNKIAYQKLTLNSLDSRAAEANSSRAGIAADHDATQKQISAARNAASIAIANINAASRANTAAGRGAADPSKSAEYKQAELDLKRNSTQLRQATSRINDAAKGLTRARGEAVRIRLNEKMVDAGAHYKDTPQYDGLNDQGVAAMKAFDANTAQALRDYEDATYQYSVIANEAKKLSEAVIKASKPVYTTPSYKLGDPSQAELQGDTKPPPPGSTKAKPQGNAKPRVGEKIGTTSGRTFTVTG